MKKLFLLFTIIGLGLTSCSNDGEVGPQGPQGPPGEDGLDGLYGYTYEVTLDLDYYDNLGYYSNIIEIPESADTPNPDGDAILMYRQEIATADDGSDIVTWSMLPQNFFVEQGTIQYVFNHSALDIELILEGNFDVSTLEAGFTEDQTFRFVVVPSDYASNSGVDISNYNAVKQSLNIKDSDIKSANILK